MVCPACSAAQRMSEPLRGLLEVKLEGHLPTKPDPLDFLPVEKRYFPSIPVGNTPLWKPERLRQKLGLSELFIKDDTVNPTFSLKDRASFLVAAFARKMNVSQIIVASTGNAASSMSGIGAASGLSVTIFIPKAAPRAKMIQSLQYGAKVILVDGNYDRAYELSLAYAKKYGGMSRNTAYHPLTIDGKKTVAIEIFQQLGRAPDHIFVPTGDGVILCAVYKGFCDLKERGFINKIPKVYAVQAGGSNAIQRALETGSFSKRASRTIADSICVDIPRAGYLSVKYLKAYRGSAVEVTDSAILQAQKELSSTTGLFTEPAGAAALAGLIAVKKSIRAKETAVVLATGSGLKDLDAAVKAVKVPKGAIRSLEEIR